MGGDVCVCPFHMSKRSRPVPRKREPAPKRARLAPVPWPDLPIEMWQEIFSHTGARARARCRGVCRAWYHTLRGFIFNVMPAALAPLRRLYLDPDPVFVKMVDEALIFPALCAYLRSYALRRVTQGEGYSIDAKRGIRDVDFCLYDITAEREVRFYADMFADGPDHQLDIGLAGRHGHLTALGSVYPLPPSFAAIIAMTNQLPNATYELKLK